MDMSPQVSLLTPRSSSPLTFSREFGIPFKSCPSPPSPQEHQSIHPTRALHLTSPTFVQPPPTAAYPRPPACSHRTASPRSHRPSHKQEQRMGVQVAAANRGAPRTPSSPSLAVIAKPAVRSAIVTRCVPLVMPSSLVKMLLSASSSEGSNGA